MKLLNNLLLLLMFATVSQGQITEYRFKREIPGITGQWHKIILPDDVFALANSDLNDIRIYGIQGKDTVEAPYILRIDKDKLNYQKIASRVINRSRNASGYYYTFVLSSPATINQVVLKFKNQNFDWRVKLEGSNDQKEWFEILHDYRILSIYNQLTDFQFTRLKFAESNYRLYRICIQSTEEPLLDTVHTMQVTLVKGNNKVYPVRIDSITVNKVQKATVIDLSLPALLPVDKVEVSVKEQFDYYRPVKVEFLADSFKTEKGWIYDYIVLASGTLNSLTKNIYSAGDVFARRLRITIQNQDNQPLTLDSVKVYGNVFELIARFNQKTQYSLYYGNKNAGRPSYDLENFANKIPDELSVLQLGERQEVPMQIVSCKEPLFKNKIWLWGIMILIIVVLGWFSLRMLHGNH